MFPPCRSQGHSVYNWADSTSPAAEPGTTALAARAPLPLSMAVKDAEQHPPQSCTPGPRRCDVMEERVGKKEWGRLIFSALMKKQDLLCRLRRGYSRPAANFLFLFGLGGRNPPTPALFPHPATMYNPSGFSLHGKICGVPDRLASLSFCPTPPTPPPLFFFQQERKFKKKKQPGSLSFSPNLELFRGDIKELLYLSPVLEASFQLISSSKNIALQKETFPPSQKTMGQCNRAPKR